MSKRDLMLDVDQAGELKAAFRRGDWTNAEIKTLSEGDLLGKVRFVVRDQAIIAPKATPNSKLELIVSGVEVPATAASSKKVLPNGKLVWYRDSSLDTLLPEELPEAPRRVVAGHKLLKL